MTTGQTDSDHVTMLLTQRFDDAAHSRIEPISTSRYSEIVQHVIDHQRHIGHLLSPSRGSIIDQLDDAEQIDQLLSRSFTLGAKTEQWSRDNIHLLCRTNQSYPRRLLQTMGDAAPPVIYYVGNLDLFYNVAIAILMPPEASSEIYPYARRIGQGLQKLGGTTAARVMTEYDKTLINNTTSGDSSIIGIMDYDFKTIIADRKFRSDLNAGRLMLVTHNCPDSTTPNTPETNTARIIGSIAGRTMRIEPGPPPQWHWADLQV